MAGGGARRGRSVVLFPLPQRGHLTPMLQLAGVLHRGGLGVTILHTTFNAPNPAAHPEFTFVAVPHGVPADTSPGLATIYSLNAAIQASACVGDALASILSEEPRPSCIVIDVLLPAVHKAALEVGLPTIVLHTGSAASVRWCRSNTMLHEKGYLPAKEEELDMLVKELSPIRVSDLFDPSRNPNAKAVLKMLDLFVETTDKCSGIVINTFEALETHELEAIRDEVCGARVFAIGPLHKLCTNVSLPEQDRSCIDWLDTQAAASVLYVSLGSVVTLEPLEFSEVAWGLAGSGRPFLWVVRPGLVLGLGSEEAELPQGFERAVEGRGKVVRWTPQPEVLAHPAVAVFLTHSGWNSTLEAICEGVPMLSRPFFGDQIVNGRYVQDAWKIGFLLQGKLERGSIQHAIARLMQVPAPRQGASHHKIKAIMCLQNDGSTQRAVHELIDHVMSL